MPLRIEDYAMIGDCLSAALVGRDGSIDWLCWPRFDLPACFAALLGTPENGRWLIAPVCATPKVSRRYLADTLVLETEFQTETGTATLVDFMPATDGEADLVRIVFGRSGEVLSIGTRSAQSIMASGFTAAQTGRTHDRTRPMLQQLRKFSPRRRRPHMTQSGHRGFRIAAVQTGP